MLLNFELLFQKLTSNQPPEYVKQQFQLYHPLQDATNPRKTNK